MTKAVRAPETAIAESWLTGEVMNMPLRIAVEDARFELKGLTEQDAKALWQQVQLTYEAARAVSDLPQINDADAVSAMAANISEGPMHGNLEQQLAVLILYFASISSIEGALVAHSHLADWRKWNIGALKMVRNMVASHTTAGLKQVASGKAGHVVTHGTDEEKAARWGDYQTEVDAVHKINPALSYDGICKNVADKFKVVSKTVWRHTNNPRIKPLQ